VTYRPTFHFPSSLRASVVVDLRLAKLEMPAPRSNLPSLGKCAEVFKDDEIILLQSPRSEIASSFRLFQILEQLNLITSQNIQTLLAMTKESADGVKGQFNESF
jgi:hypothetical protein